MTLFINLSGLLILGLIIWWFWLSKTKIFKVAQSNIIEIKVSHGIYQPALLQVKVNQPVILRFIREDATPCAGVVVFPQLNISNALSLHTPIDIPLILSQSGEYEFTCQMGMYRGKLICT